LMNEVSIVFNKIGINTIDVIKAAGTKWNFEKFYPGLVGGHCIGVDPYYMAYKAKKIKAKCDLILGGREINEQMPKYIANKFLSKINKIKNKDKKKVLIMGVTFKENCPDVRNSKIVDIINILKKDKKLNLDLYDPIANEKEYNSYDGIIIAVRHLAFKKIGLKKIKSYLKKDSILFDIKSTFPKGNADFSL
jgi:UDP-N-acetyl-D-galactosamine dehydrogenase